MQDMRFEPPKSAVADIAVDNGRRVPDELPGTSATPGSPASCRPR